MMHIEAARLLLPCVLLGTANVYVFAQDFDLGSEMTDSMAHEIDVPSWVDHEVHRGGSSGADSTENTKTAHPTELNAKPRTKPLPGTSSNPAGLDKTDPTASSSTERSSTAGQSNGASNRKADGAVSTVGSGELSGEPKLSPGGIPNSGGRTPQTNSDGSDRDEVIVIHKTQSGQYEVEKSTPTSRHSGVGVTLSSYVLTVGGVFLVIVGGRLWISDPYA